MNNFRQIIKKSLLKPNSFRNILCTIGDTIDKQLAKSQKSQIEQREEEIKVDEHDPLYYELVNLDRAFDCAKNIEKDSICIKSPSFFIYDKKLCEAIPGNMCGCDVCIFNHTKHCIFIKCARKEWPDATFRSVKIKYP